MAAENVQTFSDDNFETEVLNSETPVLVDFWAEWCQPCKMLGPVIDELAAEYDGKVKVGKLDIDSNQTSAMNFQITAIPSILIFKGGEVQNRAVGLKSKGDLQAMLNEAI